MTRVRAGLAIALLMVGMAGWGQAPVVVTAPAEKAPMSEKQKMLLDQTNALLKMAAELKVSVDKSTKDQLSLDVVRKAEAVERMAKELKGKMR